MTLANFIIAGTEKAGTTSIFTYLSTHPSVCGSTVKETDFFRNLYTGNRDNDRMNYAKYFTNHSEQKKIVMEASPGYLGSGVEVAPRIKALTPETKLLFILRNPVDRMYSSFNFHVGKLNISKDMPFCSYIDQCIAYDSGQKSATAHDLDEWYLKVIGYGRYADYLQHYYKHFPADQIKIMFFEDMNRDIHSFMTELCQFLDISPDYFADYDFKKINVTYQSKIEWLHKIAVWFNARSERFLRQRPQLKQFLVDWYKKTNQAREGYDQILEQDAQRLKQYYKPSVEALRTLIPSRSIPWEI